MWNLNFENNSFLFIKNFLWFLSLLSTQQKISFAFTNPYIFLIPIAFLCTRTWWISWNWKIFSWLTFIILLILHSFVQIIHVEFVKWTWYFFFHKIFENHLLTFHLLQKSYFLFQVISVASVSFWECFEDCWTVIIE